MQKKRDDCFRSRKNVRILLRYTKLFLTVCSMFLFCAYTTITAQISIHTKNASLEEVIWELRTKTKLTFIYSDEDIRNIKGIQLDEKDASVTSILNKCLKGTNLECLTEQETIIIRQIQKDPQQQAPQMIELKGTVKTKNGKALPGATIVIQGTSTGTASDSDGNFKLLIPEKTQAVTCSFIGMKKQTILVKGLLTLNITMEEDMSEMNEVVVTGIFQKSLSTFTGSATTVTAKELQRFGNRNVLQSLHNIDPSINIVENNAFGSNPNKLPEVQIRGNSSIPNVNELKDETRVNMNTPLVILDGFETTLQKLIDMNENEIETLTILKDASATAIYGSRGANGVIVITTKMPTMGDLKISYRGDLNIEVPDLTGYDLLEAREKLELENRVGLYSKSEIPENDWKLQRYYSYLMNEVNSGVNTYWLSKPLQTSIGQRHALKLEGGDKTFRYSASIQYNDIQGVMKQSYKKTFNGTINLSYFWKNIRFSNNLMIGLGNTRESPYGDFSTYARMNPYWRTHDKNGKILKQLGNSGEVDHVFRWSELPTNPLYNATLNTFDKNKSTDLINNFMIDWRVIPELNVRMRLGVFKNSGESDKFKPADHTDFADYAEEDMFRKGSYQYGIRNNSGYEGSLNVSYSRSINKHFLAAGVDINLKESQSRNSAFAAEGFTNERFDDISSALSYKKDGKPSGGEEKARSIGMTGNINYTYNNRYFVDISGRMDGSSQFGSNKRFAPFWSGGIGWNMHNETFLKESKWISMLKIRSSIGTSGSQHFAAYQSIPTYRYFQDDRYYVWNGSSLMALGNKDLQWQQKQDLNIGVDLKLLDNRISITGDYYISQTKRLISSTILPAANGFTSYIENIGSLKNTGYELKINAYLIRNNKISWSIAAAGIHNKNKIVSVSKALLDAQAKMDSEDLVNPNIQFKPGYSSNTIWTARSAGIDPSNGKEVFIDRYGNRTYEWNSADVVATGKDEPKLQGNFSTMLRYKGFMLNASFGYKLGGQIYNSTLVQKVEVSKSNIGWNVDSRVYNDRWKNVGDKSSFKGLDDFSPTNKTSRFVQDENTLRCQNVTLQYELKSDYLDQHLGLSYCVFSASTSDLFYISSVKRERGTSYPFSRQFSFSVNVVF